MINQVIYADEIGAIGRNMHGQSEVLLQRESVENGATGPHKLRESLPLMIFLRNRLKYASSSSH
uniref:Uncharacterized protein n=1 Tax=Megaselia scalaris TaxID=36166 RepID=T1GNX5_MEGSC